MMMSVERMGVPVALALGIAVFLAVPGQAEAQERNRDGNPAANSPEGSSLVYEREVFDYPSAGRRNPFRPLNAGERVGPRFEDLELNGVLVSPELGGIATFTDRKTNRRYRVRAGDRLGNMRIARITSEAVTLVITTYGISRQEVLRVKKDKESEG